MTRSEHYAKQIGRAYPGLPIEQVELIESGQYNDALIVNGQLLFRFPKVEPAVAAMKREAALLRAIHARLPLPVPHPLYVNEEGGVGAAFMGYRLLPGRPLWRADLEKVAEEDVLARMARQLAAFLKALHAVPLAEVPPAAVRRADDGASWSSLYRRIRRHLFPHMRPEARRRVRDRFTTFLEGAGTTAYEPALRHGDFGGGNVLWDRATGVVTGVIDFGSAAIGDPATDLASLAAGFGDAFLERCSRHYSITADMRGRMAFYRSTFALQEALFGVENDDSDAFAAGMAGYV